MEKKFYKPNLLGMVLGSIDKSMVLPQLDIVLEPIGEAIAESMQRVKSERNDPDIDEKPFLQMSIDAEAETVEQLMGCCFIVAQIYITSVMSAVRQLRELALKQKVTLACTDGSREAIMGYGNKLVGGSKYSEIEIINAFANYFKHREEWGPWDRLKNHQRRTASVVMSTGAKEFSTGNMRVGAKALSLNFDKTAEGLWDICEGWREALRSAYKSELTERGLLFGSE